MNREKLDELLELLWILKEENIDSVSENDITGRLDSHKPRLIDDTDFELKPIIETAIAENLISRNSNVYILSEAGVKKARAIIRRHRLAEKLFTDVLELSYEESEEASCKFEHILSDEVADSVCSFLGHPPICPHSKPIPRGNCCTNADTYMRPLVTPLTSLEIGKEAKITFISAIHPERLQKLSSLGLLPGETLKIIQKSPSIVIKVGEIVNALDKEVADDIYVKGV